MQKTHLAIDIGASSGRAIVGSVRDKHISLKETYRFDNGLIEINGHKCWNIAHLTESVIEGIRKTVKDGYQPSTIGIDTWAVEFVLLDENDQIIGDAVSYRDERTDGIKDELEQSGLLTFQETYARTGIQYQKFNTIYQLMALKKEHPDYLEKAKTLLMIPDYLNYILTGIKANEYTNATTTALVNAETKDWDYEIIRRLDLPEHIFQKILTPGTILGKLKPEIADKAGAEMNVILPATHDTGSAYLAVPARDDKAVFLSSGTWSLMGVENEKAITSKESCQANFTNEGGYQYRFRYLKNIMGLWMIQNIRKEAGKKNEKLPSFPELTKEAQKYADIQTIINVDDPRFLAPKSMHQEVENACQEKGEPIPHQTGAVMQVIYHSLASDYAKTLNSLSALTKKEYTSINIVGGGSQDAYLNQLTADKTGLTVFAGPTEGTALGNLIVAFIYDKEFKNLQEARDAIKESFDIITYKPQKAQ